LRRLLRKHRVQRGLKKVKGGRGRVKEVKKMNIVDALSM
jgi:hypothetical protein